MEAVGEIFTIQVRRCRRCGGILTSDQGLRDGYGHTCKMKAAEEAAFRRMMRDQVSLFDERDVKKA